MSCQRNSAVRGVGLWLCICPSVLYLRASSKNRDRSAIKIDIRPFRCKQLAKPRASCRDKAMIGAIGSLSALREVLLAAPACRSLSAACSLRGGSTGSATLRATSPMRCASFSAWPKTPCV